MKRTFFLRSSVLLLAVATLPGVLQGADIVGTVTNGTTGRPAADISVGLLALQRQMTTIADTVTDSQGRFRLAVDASPQERFLVQASYGGANYSKPVVIFGDGDTTVDVTVFDSGAKLSDLQIREHVIFVEPAGNTMGITEGFTVLNQTEPQRSYVPRDEGFRFGIPEAATDVVVTVSTQSGMPLRQQSQESSRAGQRYIGYEFRPGETRVQVIYSAPMSGDAFEYRNALALPAVARFIVIPAGGVEIAGAGLEDTNDNQTPTIRIFKVVQPDADELAASIRIDADELARFRANPPAASAEAPQSRQNPIHLIPQPVNRVQFYIVGLGLFVLGCGLYYLTLLEPTSSTNHESPAEPARNTD